MATPDEIARIYQRDQKARQMAAAAAALALWGRLNEESLTESWNAGIGQSLAQMVAQAQLAAAAEAQAYLEELAVAQGITAQVPLIVSAALAGIASDGRPLASLLYLPILLLKRLLSSGKPRAEAFQQARYFLGVLAATQVADAGRGAVQVGVAATREWVMYVRVVNLPACSRCIILAGRTYSWSTGFQRHPGCDCEVRPWHEGDPIPDSPSELFAQMSGAQQGKAFGKAGAQAIRDGADIGQVVNARRGMATAGGRLVTTEGTTVRGIAGKQLGQLKKMKGERYRRSSVPRPMPEQLYKDAAGDRDLAIDLLRRFKYIT